MIPTIEQLEEAVRPVPTTSHHAQRVMQVKTTQAMLALMRDIEAGRVKVLRCEATAEDLEPIKEIINEDLDFADEFVHEVSHDIRKKIIRRAPDIMANYWGSE